MNFLLTNWRCLLKIALVLIIIIVATYACHLSRKVDDLKVSNEILTTSLEANVRYIEKYETSRKQNESVTAQLIATVQEIPHNENCLAPASLQRVIDSL